MSSRPRVVFVDHVARLSGGEIALLRLLPALAEYVDAHVVLGEEGPLQERLAEIGVSSEVLPLDARLRDLRRTSVRVGSLDLQAVAPLPGYVLRLRRRLRALDAELVHTNSLKSAFYGALAARAARIPVVWHIRDRIADDYLPRSAVRLVRLGALILPTAVVANSQATLDTLPAVHRSSVLYNPIVPDAVEVGVRRHREESDGFMIGLVGRLAPWKGQHVFLEAFATAFRGADVQARIVGTAMFGEDDYAHGLRELAAQLGIEDQVEFRGFREDIWRELSDLDALVHSSVSPEPFGQVVLEGMAARLPVVATASGGPAELITDEVDGLLVPAGDAPALAKALVRLRNDSALRDRLATAASERSRAFTPERTAKALLEVYDSILERRRRRTGSANGR